MKIENIPSVHVMREMARRRLPKPVFDFIDGAADDEVTLNENRLGFDGIRFKPRVLNDISDRKLACTVLGTEQALPLIVGPTGLVTLASPVGESGLARAAAAFDIPFCLSTGSSESIEAVADAGCPRRWFQLYVLRDRGVTQDLIARARDSGYGTLVVTVDVPVVGKRERDIVNGFTLPLRPSARMLWEFATHPGWSLAKLKHGAPAMANVARYANVDTKQVVSHAEWINREYDPSVSWADVETIRDAWNGKLLIKGILTADDARTARSIGADGIVVSNHGGRQLDTTVTSVAALRSIVANLAGDLCVLVDSGVRRGSDIAKALCLGADAVLIGRATLYGAAAGGDAGIRRTLTILQEELDRTLALLGVDDVGALDESFIDA